MQKHESRAEFDLASRILTVTRHNEWPVRYREIDIYLALQAIKYANRIKSKKTIKRLWTTASNTS